MKLVINTCHNGFGIGLSEKAVMRYAELKGLTLYPERGERYTIYWLVPESEREDQTDFYKRPVERSQISSARVWKQILNEREIARDDLALVQVVEELGAEANGGYADLVVIEIPDGVAWQVEDDDGYEHIAEKHRTWGR